MDHTFHTLIPTVSIVLRQNGRIVLLRRSNTTYMDGRLCLPSGHVEAGETFAEAAARELSEETSVDADPRKLQLLHVMQRRIYYEDGSHSERIDAYFDALDWQGEPSNAEPHKCSELLWADPDDLPTDMVPEVAQVIKAIQSGSVYSEYGYDN